MDFEIIKLTDIIPAEYNPRKISDDEYGKLVDSITKFGLVDPIIINLKNNRIIGGHQRYNVLVEEYLSGDDDEMILIRLGDIGWVFPSDNLLIESENHEKALNVALNKISGQWDNKKLHNLLVNLNMEDVDLDLTGFEEFEIEKLVFENDIEWADVDSSLESDVEEQGESDEELESYDVEGHITCPACGGKFDPEDVE